MFRLAAERMPSPPRVAKRRRGGEAICRNLPRQIPFYGGERTISNAEVPLSPRPPFSPWLPPLLKYCFFLCADGATRPSPLKVAKKDIPPCGGANAFPSEGKVALRVPEDPKRRMRCSRSKVVFPFDTSSVSYADSCLAAARSRRGSDVPPARHSLPRRRFATSRRSLWFAAEPCRRSSEAFPSRGRWLPEGQTDEVSSPIPST